MGVLSYGDRVYYEIPHRNTAGRVISRNAGYAKLIDDVRGTTAELLTEKQGITKMVDTRYLKKASKYEDAYGGGARRSRTRKARKSKRGSTRKN